MYHSSFMFGQSMIPSFAWFSRCITRSCCSKILIYIYKVTRNLYVGVVNTLEWRLILLVCHPNGRICCGFQ